MELGLMCSDMWMPCYSPHSGAPFHQYPIGPGGHSVTLSPHHFAPNLPGYNAFIGGSSLAKDPLISSCMTSPYPTPGYVFLPLAREVPLIPTTSTNTINTPIQVSEESVIPVGLVEVWPVGGACAPTYHTYGSTLPPYRCGGYSHHTPEMYVGILRFSYLC